MTTEESGPFHVQTFLTFGEGDDNYYLVETDLSSLTVTPNTAAQLKFASVARSEAKISYDTQLYICFTASQPVPAFSTVTIGFPEDQVVFTGDLTGDLEVVTQEAQEAVFLLPEKLDADETTCFTIDGGLRNANEIGEDSSFTIVTATSDGA